MIRAKKSIICVAAVVFCFSLLTLGGVSETNAAPACYILFHTWDSCDTHYLTWDFTYLFFYVDGTFDDLGGGWGDWGWYGASLFLQYKDDLEGSCDAFYSGTKKQGNKQCTDGSFPGSVYPPGCWYLKKSKACFDLNEKDTGGDQGRLTSGAIRAK